MDISLVVRRIAGTILALGAGSGALAQPVVRDAAVSVYASVADPQMLAFAPDGTLFVGRDNSGSGGGSGDAVKIWRVAPGGVPATEFGASAVPDPDAVIVDATGAVSGVAGAVLVGGTTSGTMGQVARIDPGGAVTSLFGPSSDYSNPSGFTFDLNGRLLFTCYGNGRVYAASKGAPTVLFTLSFPNYIEVDAANRIVVSSSESRLQLYTEAGALSNANFATVKAATPIARGPGGNWGTDIYAVGTGGELLRIGLNGNVTNVGSGFSAMADLKFGPDGALYASEFEADRVWRIGRPRVAGTTTTIYARVTDPTRMAFAPDGTMFVGRDNSGSGGGYEDAVKIHRIGLGGAPVTEFGNTAITDPDGVAYDATGSICGTPGAIIVGGVELHSAVGKLSKIAPDGTVSTFYGPTTFGFNPNEFLFEDTGRLLITDDIGNAVWQMTNGTPQMLLSLARAFSVATDVLGRLLVTSENDALVRLYTADGVLVTNAFASAATGTCLARGPGGFWGREVYFIGANGNLMRVNTTGVVTQVGLSFQGLSSIAFGADGALYATQFDNDLIWRLALGSAPVSLRIERAGAGQVIVSWVADDAGWILKSADGLSGSTWQTIGSGVLVEGRYTVMQNVGPGSKYFRLER